MIRTFHTKIDKPIIVLSLMPVTVLAVYFFWNLMPIAGALCLTAMTFIVERVVHSKYVLTDDGQLLVHHGRLSKVKVWQICEIAKAECFETRGISLLRNKRCVLLTFTNGHEVFITPHPCDEFCKVLNKKKTDLCAS